MIEPITFIVPGQPVGWARPRFNGKQAYSARGNRVHRHAVQKVANQHFKTPLEGPLKITVAATFEPFPSWTKKKTRELLNRPHTQKPDLDNVVKAVADALNNIAYVDDTQLAQIEARKIWGPTSQTVITIERLTA